jgi:hypothetical protein
VTALALVVLALAAPAQRKAPPASGDDRSAEIPVAPPAPTAESPPAAALAPLPVQIGAPAATPAEPAGDPCQADPRCRLDRLRAARAEERRRDYVSALSRYAAAVERAEQAALPVRERHPIGADFEAASVMPAKLALLGYTVAWPLRLEFFGGVGEHNDYQTQYAGSAIISSDLNLSMKSYGFAARWFASPGMFAPYLLTGLGWSTGTFDTSTYIYNNNGGGGSSMSEGANVSAHTLYAGVGLDFQWDYLHLALGYRFSWAFFAAAYDDKGRRQDGASQALGRVLDDAMHGFIFDVGARF